MNFFIEQLQRNDLVAAPMAGISCPPFRKLLRDYTDGLVYTEMVSVEGVSRDSQSSTDYLYCMAGDKPVVVQLFGGNSESYAGAIRIAEELYSAVAFDINMGCPVKKVVKTGGGASLLRNLDNIKKIVKAVRGATVAPFSIKIRLGWDDDSKVYNEVLDIAEGEGADCLIVHGRTRNQMFSGDIDYDAIASLAARATIPIIGNGNVMDVASYNRMKQTGVAGVMIGRGMMYAPWIFSAIKRGVEPLDYLSPQEIYGVLIKLDGYMLEHAGDIVNKKTHYLNILKKFAVWFSRGMRDAAEFRKDVYADDSREKFMNRLLFFRDYIF